MKNFCFRKIINGSRKLADGSIENFTTRGITRVEFSIDTENCNLGKAKCVFLLSPEIAVKAGDVLVDDGKSYLLEKVSAINDFDGVLLAYRAISVN